MQVTAQNPIPKPGNSPSGDLPMSAKEDIHYKFVQSQLEITNLSQESYDKVAILDLQGNIIQKKYVSGDKVCFDVSFLNDAVYLLMFQSSTTFKQKTIKFIIRK